MACKHWKCLAYLLEIPDHAYTTLSKSDWLFNTQSRVLQADWFILEINEEATLNINMPYTITQSIDRAGNNLKNFN